VPAQDAHVAQAGDPGGVDVQLVAHGKDLVAGQPVDAGREQHAEQHHRYLVVPVGHRQQQDQQEQPGEGHHQGKEPFHSPAQPRAEVAADQSRRHADRECHTGADQPGDQRGIDGEEQTGEDVAAFPVAAE
jgi:hypothetical protein